ncbi:DUF5069 domain-containing protein [Synoicihabitans lomoniglobus]|uniref:DUF5069 domain-containing protein n=1 Tax=Synoicihabitans lomoniglobus TaxID=2909285 RepID=A0AAF0CM81_9BACT|nr:DUF5069 domain-containing protein [Opitutaceae bacterium LMO-M01]WED63753.1 DUF5069 domain-containing protein [Opitutaceae bacterium LMO-M01]
MKLRRPWDELAGCMWLARFFDKARLHLAGKLGPDFEPFFGHKLATDGTFFAHFELSLEEVLPAVAAANDDDDAFAAWFAQRPASSPARIAAWNEIAYNLGKPGHLMERSYAFAKRRYYKTEDPRLDGVFAGIAWDEGYLDEMPRR